MWKRPNDFNVNFLFSVFVSKQPHRPADSTGECQVRCLSLCVRVRAVDAMSLISVIHTGGQQCIHHQLSGSPAACMCVRCCVPWYVLRLSGSLTALCRRRWCQTMFRQCFHCLCVCVCPACEMALGSSPWCVFGVFVCVCVCVLKAPVFSRLAIPVWYLHMSNLVSSAVTECCT